MGKVNIKDKAPHFKLESYNAGTIDLAELIGKQKIVLIFSRYFGCPICQLDLKSLMERFPEIEEKGSRIVYITQSGEEIAKEFIENEDIPFPVLPSSRDKLYKDYGLGMMNLAAVSKVAGKKRAAKKAGIEHGEYEGWELQSPGQFIINEEGIIIHAKKGWLDLDSLLKDL